MQTREPNKRVNWILVLILVIAIPFTIITFVMLNTVGEEVSDTPEPQKPEIETMEDTTQTTDSL